MTLIDRALPLLSRLLTEKRKGETRERAIARSFLTARTHFFKAATPPYLRLSDEPSCALRTTMAFTYRMLVLLFFSWWSVIPFGTVQASTPNMILSVDGLDNKEWLTKRGYFGSSADRLEGRLVHSPGYDELLCEYYNEDSNLTDWEGLPVDDHEPWIMMVPRGLCTYERKAYAAKVWYKASGILIYDNLSARYGWNNETEKFRYPRDEWDYECSFGFGFVYDIELDPPAYSREDHDPILDMTSPLSNCTLEETREPCESQLCLVTGPAAENSTKYPVCCAWDLPQTMGGDDSAGDTDDVMAVFLTIRQGEELIQHIGGKGILEARPFNVWNASMIILWLLGVFVTFIASWFAASDYRIFRAQMASYEANKQNRNTRRAEGSNAEAGWEDEAPSTSDFDDLALGLDDMNSDDDEDGEDAPEDGLSEGDSEDDENDNGENVKESKEQTKKNRKKKHVLHSLPPKGKEKDKGKVWVLYSLPPPERKTKAKKKQRPGYKAELTGKTDILPTDGGAAVPEPWAAPMAGTEMTHWHVFGFIVSSSILLFLLFYFKFYWLVFIVYGIGCAGAVSYLIFGPILVRVIPLFGDAVVKELNKNVLCRSNGFDVTSQLMGYSWAFTWIWYGMTHYRPSTNAFYWITIDIFGACFCVLMLSMMKLKNIKIATMLLVAVFVYDIFFVFITPLFMGGESVMITVAKGGGGGGSEDAIADDFCYKYPEDKDCTGIDSLPMLLIVPRFNDYTNGSSLLGLGDIVLPGYLIAFGARLDEAKRIVGKHSIKEMEYTEKWYQGYFFWLMVSYCIGLALAFVAYGATELGQPALLYLVPCCLSMLVIVGRKELRNLWTGARAIRLADKLKEKCERAWGKEKMRRDVAKAKRDRGERGTQGAHPYRASQRESQSHPPSGRGGRSSQGRGRGRDGGRGRSGRGKSLTGLSKRDATNSPSRRESAQRESVSKRESSKLISPTRQSSSSIAAGERSPGRYTATLDGSPSPMRALSSRISSRKSLPPKPNLDEDDGPKENDIRFIRFGDTKCLGSKHLRTVVKRELKTDPHADFNSAILKTIKQRLWDRNFLISDENGGWREATNKETKHEINAVFSAERSKLQAKGKRKSEVEGEA